MTGKMTECTFKSFRWSSRYGVWRQPGALGSWKSSHEKEAFHMKTSANTRCTKSSYLQMLSSNSSFQFIKKRHITTNKAL